MITTTTDTAMTAARELRTRPWMGSTTAYAVDLRTAQGRTVPAAGIAADDRIVADGRVSGVASAPTTGYVHPRLEAPPA
jgi:hypothetical protein